MQTDGMASNLMPFFPNVLLWISNKPVQPKFGRVADRAVR